MEENGQAKNAVVSWSVVGTVFVVIVLVLLLQFMNEGRNAAKKQVGESLVAQTYGYATVLNSKIEKMETAALLLSETSGESEGADLLSSQYSKEGGIKEALKIGAAIVDNSEASHVYYVKDGKLLYNELGRKPEYELSVDSFLGKTHFSEIVKYDDEVGYVLLVGESDSNGGFFVIETPFSEIEKNFELSAYESNAFLCVTEQSGETLGFFERFKDTDSMFFLDDNFNDSVRSEMTEKEIIGFNVRLVNKSSFSESVKCRGDLRTVAISPVKSYNLVFGVRQPAMDKAIDRAFYSVRGAVIRLGIVLVLFTIFVVSTIIMASIRTKERGRVLEDKADTDLLTDLNNKAATERKIQEYLSDNPNGRGLMFILDIDNFKKINDTMGHAFGDTLLKTLGKEIRAEFRMSDIIGRTGGDEFMVFLKDVTDDMIVEREANRITRFFHDFKAGGDYVKYSASASIGAAIYPDDAKNFKDLYVAADQALYKAKKRGKNQLVFYNETARK